MYEHGSLPRARQEGLLEETVGEELLLYDQNSHTAHCLSPIAACVWRQCDGNRDLAELAVVAGVNEELVADALHELREKDLLDAQSTSPGESRREAIGRAARYGAAAAGGAMIVSATAATPAMASSSGFEESAVKWECVTKEKAENCCICKNMEACRHEAGEEKDCKKACEEVYGANSFNSWKKEAKCTVK